MTLVDEKSCGRCRKPAVQLASQTCLSACSRSRRLDTPLQPPQLRSHCRLAEPPSRPLRKHPIRASSLCLGRRRLQTQLMSKRGCRKEEDRGAISLQGVIQGTTQLRTLQGD